MSAVRVTPARSARALRAWIRFPRRRLYGAESLWVPPLDADIRRLLDARRNPYFRHAVAAALLARGRWGKVVGRVLAHVNHRYNVRHGERAVLFGFFECVDDPAVARALLREVAVFGQRHGCTTLRGPFSLTLMQEIGLLRDGFEAPPALDEAYSAPYYPALLEAAGLRPVFPMRTYRLDNLAVATPPATPRGPITIAGARLTFRQAHARTLDRDIEAVREILNDSFYDHPHFVPLTADEWRFQVGRSLRLIDPRIMQMAELDGVPVGFVLCVPDFNPLLKRLGGRAGLRALPVLLRERQPRRREAVVTLMCVLRHLQGRGIMSALHAELLRSLRARGYRALTITWVADDNVKSLATIAALGGLPYHHLTLYEAPIASV